MRKETYALAFEGKITKSLAIPLLAEYHCSIRLVEFCNRRIKRICWSIGSVISLGRPEDIVLILYTGEKDFGLLQS